MGPSVSMRPALDRNPGVRGPGEVMFALPMRTFAHNVVRLVARVQTQVALEKTLETAPWQTRIIGALEDLADRVGPTGAMRKLYEWSQGDFLESGGGANAITDLSKAHGTRQFQATPSTLDEFATHVLSNAVKIARLPIPANLAYRAHGAHRSDACAVARMTVVDPYVQRACTAPAMLVPGTTASIAWTPSTDTFQE